VLCTLKGEFNLATPKELFSYGAKRNNLALQLVAKFSKNKFTSKPYVSQILKKIVI